MFGWLKRNKPVKVEDVVEVVGVQILNYDGEVVDIVETKHAAFTMVTFLDRTNPANGPHTCK